MVKNTEIIREAVGIFNNNEKLQAAINELSLMHFERYDISVLGSETAIKEKFNKEYKDSHELVDNPITPRNVNITPEEIGIAQGAVIGGSMLVGVVAALTAAGGVTLPSSIPAAIVGVATGTVIGGALSKLVGDSYLERLQKQVDNGGVIIWVRTSNKKREKIARRILKRYGAGDIHMHDIRLVA